MATKTSNLSGCLLLIVFASIFCFVGGCADSKTFEKTDDFGRTIKIYVEPYGWANEEAKRVPGVVYQVNAGNVVWSILLFETIVAPVWLTGWYLYEPVRLEN